MGVTIDGTPIEIFAEMAHGINEKFKRQAEKLTLSDFGINPGEKMMIITDLSQEILDGRSCGIDSIVVLGCFIVITTLEQLATLEFDDVDFRYLNTPENISIINNKGFLVIRGYIGCRDQLYGEYIDGIKGRGYSVLSVGKLNLSFQDEYEETNFMAKWYTYRSLSNSFTELERLQKYFNEDNLIQMCSGNRECVYVLLNLVSISTGGDIPKVFDNEFFNN